MKFYLSSYRFGNETETLKRWITGTNGRFGYIPNACDSFVDDADWSIARHIQEDMDSLREIGAEVELLDLKEYFGKQEELRAKLAELGGVYVSGGNSFVLRQAMRLSGFDVLLPVMRTSRENFVYAAYSAGVCVLGPSMRVHALTDDANVFPYPQITEQIWDGIGILDFVFEPHYASNHPESASVEREVAYCVENKILFKAYHDGEVLLLKV